MASFAVAEAVTACKSTILGLGVLACSARGRRAGFARCLTQINAIAVRLRYLSLGARQISSLLVENHARIRVPRQRMRARTWA